MNLTDADMSRFHQKRGKEKTTSKRHVSQGTIRADFKSIRSAVNWAINRKPPLLANASFAIPKITSTTVKPFLPTEEFKRLLESATHDERNDLSTRWVLDLKEVSALVKMTAKKMPEMLLPIQLVASTGMRRIQLVRLKKSDYVKGRLTITSRKGARQKGLSEIALTIELRDSVAKALQEHIKKLPNSCPVMFPIFQDFDYTGCNKRWKNISNRSIEQRRCDRADRVFEKLVNGTDFERLDGYHALRHSFVSVLVAEGKTWDQIAAFVGHLDTRTTQRYIHFMPKDKRDTANSIPFEF